jgi:hypothetical protein
MVAGIPVTSIYLMIVGGIATALAMAALRHEWSWVLALGLPLLLASERAGLPPAIFAWGCAAYAVVFLAFTGALAGRMIGSPVGVLLGGAVLLAGFSAMPAAAMRHDGAPLSLEQPPTFGVRLAAMLGALADDPRYAAD